jgi:hypothetical protein
VLLSLTASVIAVSILVLTAVIAEDMLLNASCILFPRLKLI